MDSVQQIALTVITSIITAIVVGYIQHLFYVRETKLSARKEISVELSKQDLGMYREVAEIVYKIRNAARDCVSKEVDGEARQMLASSAWLLTQNLFKYKVLYPQDVFDQLHLYKQETQDFGLLLDRATRPLNGPSSKTDSDMQVLAQEQLAGKYAAIEDLFQALDPKLRSYFQEMREIKC